MRNDKEIKDVVNKINSTFYEIQKEQMEFLDEVQEFFKYNKSYFNAKKNEFRRLIQIFKNLLLRLNVYTNIQAYTDWESIWRG